MYTNKLTSGINSVIGKMTNISRRSSKKNFINLTKPIINKPNTDTIPDEYCEKAWKEFQTTLKKAKAEFQKKKSP